MESGEEVLLASSLQNTHVNEIVEVANLEILEDALFIKSVHLDHVLYALVATQVNIRRRLPTNLHAGLAAVRRSGASLSLFKLWCSSLLFVASKGVPQPWAEPAGTVASHELVPYLPKPTSETPEKRKWKGNSHENKSKKKDPRPRGGG